MYDTRLASERHALPTRERVHLSRGRWHDLVQVQPTMMYERRNLRVKRSNRGSACQLTETSICTRPRIWLIPVSISTVTPEYSINGWLLQMYSHLIYCQWMLLAANIEHCWHKIIIWWYLRFVVACLRSSTHPVWETASNRNPGEEYT